MYRRIILCKRLRESRLPHSLTLLRLNDPELSTATGFMTPEGTVMVTDAAAVVTATTGCLELKGSRHSIPGYIRLDHFLYMAIKVGHRLREPEGARKRYHAT